MATINTSLLMVMPFSDLWVLSIILLGCFLVLILLVRYRAKQRNSQTAPLLCRPVTFEELPELHKYCLAKFGDQISDLSVMKLWFERNNGIFEILTRAAPGKAEQDKIEGYFSVLPLTDDARKAVAKGIYSGATLPPDSVTNDESAGAIYVGGVAA